TDYETAGAPKSYSGYLELGLSGTSPTTAG
ncbi:hypothetical protein A2U01_0104571, partial [Trifolium medium]|nr:hypothetical protein [Trifolium medium]